MRVVCKANRGLDLPEGMRAGPDRVASAEYEFDLSIGASYVVCAMYRVDDHVGYVLDAECRYAEPSPLFDILDGRLSRCWIVGEECRVCGPDEYSWHTDWGYPEFVTNPQHYAALVDGDRYAVTLFNKYRRFMEIEFPDPNDTAIAVALDDEWLQCVFCADAWKDKLQLGRVQCPKCNRMMNNPHYRDAFDPSIFSEW